MNFTEKQPGVWLDSSEQYRISTASILKCKNGDLLYYAAVLCEQIDRPDQRFWACAGAMRPYKTMVAAIKAATKHRRLWTSAIRASRRQDWQERLERIRLRGHLGTGRSRNYVFTSLPVWVREKSPKSPERIIPGYRKLVRESCVKLTNKSNQKLPSDPTKTSPSSVCDTSVPSGSPVESAPAPVSSALPVAGSITQTDKPFCVTETGSANKSSAKPARAPAGARRKSASRSTKKSSIAGKSRSRSSKLMSPGVNEPLPS